ncbi:CRISPR system precrRNA processing endoribonuclease RAMP protein Cas6 [Sulfurimonas sp. SAG-AH-194-C21]|nr:CRISPR system precrRNA processing endoribonuclease RAMP protein Cas6 [Sulfurimonas sp. SAG-AH-194-C21]MDF1884320.1 CRISPR system precrRNA processing endoribonuclease RAMP protein Cas6 [Sulfurimonas sp. SAG-AH-194-C21]
MEYLKLSYKIDAKKPYIFIGSKIRGAFGYALKEEVCVNPIFKCENCFSAKECIFYDFYEAQNTTNNFRLDFKLFSKKYKFSLLLFGEAQKHKSALHNAMMNSLKEYKNIDFKEKVKNLEKKKTVKIIKLSFITPLRMKKKNRFATRDIDLLDILLSIYKRHRDLKGLDFERANIDTSYKVVSKHLLYQELTRRSNKQNTKMQLGGLMGEMVISNVSKEVYNLLKLGEVIGVGKSTVFGLGKIKIEDVG